MREAKGGQRETIGTFGLGAGLALTRKVAVMTEIRTESAFDLQRDRLVLVNLSAQPLALQVYPVDADPDDQGGTQLPPAGVTPRSTGSWFHLSLDTRTTVEVAARGTLILPFIVGCRVQP